MKAKLNPFAGFSAGGWLVVQAAVRIIMAAIKRYRRKCIIRGFKFKAKIEYFSQSYTEGFTESTK